MVGKRAVGRAAGQGSIARYLDASRSGRTSVLLTAPVVLLYEVGLLLWPGGVRNAADALIDGTLGRLGRPATLALNLIVLAVFAVAALRGRKGAPARPGLMLPVMLESAIYACMLAPVIGALSGRGLSMAAPGDQAALQATVLSLGAGFYEELVFRLGGIAGVFIVMRRLIGFDSFVSVLVPLLGSSLAFAAFHHVGPGAEPFSGAAFAFRIVAGILLGVLFILRGFGVTCYTHVIYDLMCVWAK